MIVSRSNPLAKVLLRVVLSDFYDSSFQGKLSLHTCNCVVLGLWLKVVCGVQYVVCRLQSRDQMFLSHTMQVTFF
jgi:hypothetical protein